MGLVLTDQPNLNLDCAQRAHANFLEHYPLFLVGLLGSGIRYPVVASTMGVFWGVFRVAYLWGYTQRDKTKGEGRNAGRGYEFAEAGLILLAAWSGVEMLMS